MTDRADIASGRLAYSCNCGWIDWGHANPSGAQRLWNAISGERHEQSLAHLHVTLQGRPAFLVEYAQRALVSRVVGRTYAGMQGTFVIRRGLSLAEQKRVAFAIFLRVSFAFEGLQEAAGVVTSRQSGFAVEDLVSNVLGFYMAVNGYTPGYVRERCRQVSAQASYAVYDAGHYVGQRSTDYRQPRYFPCRECATPGAFPPELRTLAPSPEGDAYRALPALLAPPRDVATSAPLSNTFDVDASGRVHWIPR